MQSLNGLIWRNLSANRSRTLVSIIAVSFGVAATIGGSVIAQSTRKAIISSEDLAVVMGGLVGQMDTMMMFISIIIMLAAGFLIFNAFAMTITQRRQQIGGLRAIGMTRAQVIRLTLVEGITIGLSGLVIGLLTGPILGQGMIALIKQFGGGLLAFEDASATTTSYIIAVVLGIGIPLLSIWFPARRAARTGPLDALRQPEAASVDGVPGLQTTIALVAVFLFLAYLIIAPPGEWVQYPTDGALAGFFMVLWVVLLALLLPAFIDVTGRIAERILRSSGTQGRLMADNLRRGRSRVTMTILTLALALTIITGMTGFIHFGVNRLFGTSLASSVQVGHLFVARINVAAGWESIMSKGFDSVLMSQDETKAVEAVLEGRATTSRTYFINSPELSFLGDAYFSYLMDPDALAKFGDAGFKFIKGDWDTALPIMQQGCGVLVSPLVANKNNASLGNTISVTSPSGPINCIVAGIGTSTAGASVVSSVVADQFQVTNPVMVQIVPNNFADLESIESGLLALQSTYPLLEVNRVEGMVETFDTATGFIVWVFNGLLVLAVGAAAMSVVNTTLMSVNERRREIGLLRAVGSTRRQVRTMIVGEAALMGFIGGIFGLIAGLGLTAIFVVTYGGNSFGLTFPLWPTALEEIAVAQWTGLLGLIAAPIIAAAAAWLPSRRILREKPVETLALS